MKKNYKSILAIVILSITLCLCWWTLWQREAEIHKLKTDLSVSRANEAELRGDIEDMRDVMKYYREYSFHFVMNIIIAKAAKLKIPINAALALAQIESNFDPYAVSSTDDFGIYQVNGKYHKFDRALIFLPEYNIEIAFKILSDCYKQAGSWEMAVALYNRGRNYKLSDHPRKLSESIFIRREP